MQSYILTQRTLNFHLSLVPVPGSYNPWLCLQCELRPPCSCNQTGRASSLLLSSSRRRCARRYPNFSPRCWSTFWSPCELRTNVVHVDVILTSCRRLLRRRRQQQRQSPPPNSWHIKKERSSQSLAIAINCRARGAAIPVPHSTISIPHKWHNPQCQKIDIVFILKNVVLHIAVSVVLSFCHSTTQGN